MIKPTITRATFNRAASLVRAILDGEWTNDPPSWAGVIPQGKVDAGYSLVQNTDDYTRAVQTAEAFILLFRSANDRFDETKFLRACGFNVTPKGRT